MIFVSAGHKEFDRLIEKMDSIAKNTSREIIMQIGDKPTYLPENTEYFYFLPRKEIDEYFQNAELIITHCAVGTLLKAKNYLKPLIMVPRMKSHREVSDDHQIEFAKMLVQQQKIQGAKFVFDLDQLEQIIDDVLSKQENFVVKSSEDKANLINTLREFILNSEFNS